MPLHCLVITDDASVRADLGSIRYTSQHPTANVTGQKDAITAFTASRSVTPNAVAHKSWDYKRLRSIDAQTSRALDLGELPVLEIYDGSGAYRWRDPEAAQRRAGLASAALELNAKHFEGQGSARHLRRRHAVQAHRPPASTAPTPPPSTTPRPCSPRHQRDDNAFTILAVEHHATNNLGAQIAKLLNSTDLEQGTYKNHFHAAPAAAAVVPHPISKPTSHGAQTALVVGIDKEPLSTERELRVKVQFPWQRGERPLSGGMSHDAASADAKGNAPGQETSGTWVRVAHPSAGANWGASLIPRIGTEVSISYVEGDIDRPVITGQLYNGADTPPFVAGVDSGVNHPGVISGIHSHHLDGGGHNQWILDDATGQLRTRLASSTAQAQISLGPPHPAKPLQRPTRRLARQRLRNQNPRLDQPASQPGPAHQRHRQARQLWQRSLRPA